MLSRQNGRFSRTVLSALAALVAAAVPTFVSSAALAETPSNGSTPSADADKAPAKAEKHTKKTHAARGQKAQHKAESKPDQKPAQKPSTQKAPKGKKTASRNAAGAKKKTTAKKDSDSSPQRRQASIGRHDKPCFGHSVAIDRGGLEAQTLTLVDCKGNALEDARERLSVLARPWGAPKPGFVAVARAAKKAETEGHKTAEVARGVRLLEPGVLARVDAIAKHWNEKSLSLVSGYRPQSKGSLHQSARAVDLRVNGVSNEELVAFCRTLKDTGCGYYPNSSFVHVDVRNPGTGSVTWIDASGPGESPRYVTQWPPPANEPDQGAPAGADAHDADVADDANPKDDPYDVTAPFEADVLK